MDAGFNLKSLLKRRVSSTSSVGSVKAAGADLRVLLNILPVSALTIPLALVIAGARATAPLATMFAIAGARVTSLDGALRRAISIDLSSVLY